MRISFTLSSDPSLSSILTLMLAMSAMTFLLASTKALSSPRTFAHLRHERMRNLGVISMIMTGRSNQESCIKNAEFHADFKSVEKAGKK